MSVSLTANANYATVSFVLSLLSSDCAHTGNLSLQLYLHGINSNRWIQVNPGQTIAVYPGNIPIAVSFSQVLTTVDNFDEARVLLFGSGGTSDVALDITVPCVFSVSTLHVQVTSPQMTIGTPLKDPTSGNWFSTVTLAVPNGYINNTNLPYNGLWVQLKGLPNLIQQWFYLTGANALQPANDPSGDNYQIATFQVPLGNPPNGIYDLQGDIYNWNWTPITSWVYPGVIFEIGESLWIKRDTNTRPTVEQAFTKQGKSPVAIGGNIGNFSLFVPYGSYNDYGDPGYLSLLKSLGINWLRENIDPDQYLNSQTYRDIIRSHAEAMWMAGIVPVLAPQDEPTADTLAHQDVLLLTLVQQMCNDYSDASDNIVLEPLNEPHLHPQWLNDWQPLVISLLQAMRNILPNGHFWCPTENYCNSIAAATLNPLPAGLCDAYDVHAYVDAKSLLVLIQSSLPVVIGEYHNTTTAFHSTAISAGNVIAMGAWAWDYKSPQVQDQLALVDHQAGASLVLAPDGTLLAQYYSDWINGTALPVPPPPPPPPMTTGMVLNLIAGQLTPIQANINRLTISVNGINSNINTINQTLSKLQTNQSA